MTKRPNKTKQNGCFKCDTTVDQRLSLNGECDICIRSYHSGCISLAEATLKDLKVQGYPIYGDDCKHGCGMAMKTLKNVEKRVEALESSGELVNQKLNKLEQGGPSEAVEELLRRDRCKKNIIIHGVSESIGDSPNKARMEDDRKTQKVIESALGNGIETTDIRVKRLGPPMKGKDKSHCSQSGRKSGQTNHNYRMDQENEKRKTI